MPHELLQRVNDVTGRIEPFIRVGEICQPDPRYDPHLVWAQAICRLAQSVGENAEIAGALGRRRQIATEHASKLEAVADALPTRSVGTFPGNLRPVTELVNAANKELDY